MKFINVFSLISFVGFGLFSPLATAMEGASTHKMLMVDQLEYAGQKEGDFNWDLMAWVGNDWNRIWLKSEGEVPTSADALGTESQLLYSRLISPFWEAQVGARADYELEGSDSNYRVFGVLALSGLAPYWFELEPSIFVSQDGDLSARFMASLDLRITQRLIMAPSVEVNAALQSVPEFGVGQGLNDVSTELRIRYEFAREFAPYLGVGWVRHFGETADFIEASGGDVSALNAVVGVRFWL
jgi:copper resistance protein B